MQPIFAPSETGYSEASLPARFSAPNRSLGPMPHLIIFLFLCILGGMAACAFS